MEEEKDIVVSGEEFSKGNGEDIRDVEEKEEKEEIKEEE